MTLSKKHNLTYIVGACAAAMLLTSAASARPFDDTNQDGQITIAEFMASSDARFVKSDINGDGFLSTEERDQAKTAARKERSARKFSKLDVNGDGVITESEFSAASDARNAEMAERREERRAQMEENGQDQATQGKRRGFMGKRGKRKAGGNHWAKIDTDNDGFISRGEYDVGAKAMFERLDSNNDGVLTKGEGRKGPNGRKHRR